MNAPMANLPVVIFQFAMSPYDDWKTLAWAGALLITLTVLVLNILARSVFRQTVGALNPNEEDRTMTTETMVARPEVAGAYAAAAGAEDGDPSISTSTTASSRR